MLPVRGREPIERRRDVARVDHSERTAPTGRAIPVAIAEHPIVATVAQDVAVPDAGIVHHVDPLVGEVAFVRPRDEDEGTWVASDSLARRGSSPVSLIS